jgi:hypothetical protein
MAVLVTAISAFLINQQLAVYQRAARGRSKSGHNSHG